jgi:hypothetical protein
MLTLAGCCSTLANLSRAAAKSAAAKLRRIGAAPVHPRWTQRAAICEFCPLRVVRSGKSFCGNPLLQQIHREPALDGCGCPTHDKARSPDEHCPIDEHHQPSRQLGGACSCKWCVRLERSY